MERQACADRACQELSFPFTTLIDHMDDQVAIRWTGWPERLFVISQEGRVVYTGDQGPMGFNPGAGYKGFRGKQPGLSLRRFLSAWLTPQTH